MGGLGVEIGAPDADEEGGVNSGGGGGTGSRFSRYAADGRSAKEIGRAHEVVGIPLTYGKDVSWWIVQG